MKIVNLLDVFKNRWNTPNSNSGSNRGSSNSRGSNRGSNRGSTSGSSNSRGSTVGSTRNVSRDISNLLSGDDGSNSVTGTPEATLQSLIDSVNSNYGNRSVAQGTANWENLMQALYFQQNEQSFNASQNDLAYLRQRYETDLAYNRTKFETLFNQYLAAGMSPAAALQAAAGSSPDVSGSSPAPAAGSAGNSGLSSGNTIADDIAPISSFVQFAGSLAQSGYQFAKSLKETQRQFNISNLGNLLTSEGLSEYEPQFTRMYGSDGFVPFMSVSRGDFDSPEKFNKGLEFLLNSDIPDNIKSSIKAFQDYDIAHSNSSAYQAASRFHFYNEQGPRSFKQLSDYTDMARKIARCSYHIQNAQAWQADLSIQRERSIMSSIFDYAIKNDPDFVNSIGLYYDEDNQDWYVNNQVIANRDIFTGDLSYQHIETLDQLRSYYLGQGITDVPASEFFQIPAYRAAMSSDFFSQLAAGMTWQDTDYFNDILSTRKNSAAKESLMSQIDFFNSLLMSGIYNDSDFLRGTGAALQIYRHLGLYDAVKDLGNSAIDLIKFLVPKNPPKTNKINKITSKTNKITPASNP